MRTVETSLACASDSMHRSQTETSKCSCNRLSRRLGQPRNRLVSDLLPEREGMGSALDLHYIALSVTRGPKFVICGEGYTTSERACPLHTLAHTAPRRQATPRPYGPLYILKPRGASRLPLGVGAQYGACRQWLFACGRCGPPPPPPMLPPMVGWTPGIQPPRMPPG